MTQHIALLLKKNLVRNHSSMISINISRSKSIPFGQVKPRRGQFEDCPRGIFGVEKLYTRKIMIESCQDALMLKKLRRYYLKRMKELCSLCQWTNDGKANLPRRILLVYYGKGLHRLCSKIS